MLPPIGTVRKRRSMLGMTQKNLADLAGISQSIVAKVERSFVDPSYTTATRIFEALERVESKTLELANLNLVAKDLMTRELFSVKSTDKISVAKRLMVEHHISQLPVLDDLRVSIGSVTEAQILATQRSDNRVQVVKDIMLEPFPAVSENCKFSTIRAILLLEAAVVVSDQKGVCGIITKFDLIKDPKGVKN